MTRRCTKCRQYKKLDKFGKHGKYLNSRCNLCRRKYDKPTAEQTFKVKLKYYYGLTHQEYFAQLRRQKEVCAICGKKCALRLSIDHNHATGRLRGLLCMKCNLGIGCLRDSVEILKKAYKYIKRGCSWPGNPRYSRKAKNG